MLVRYLGFPAHIQQCFCCTLHHVYISSFFLEHMYLDHDGWNLIFYTGKAPLTTSVEDSNANIRVIRGRPQLSSLIPNVIYGCESDSLTFSLWEESEEQQTRVKRLEDHVMSSWGMMYCGGSKDVLSALRGISMDYSTILIYILILLSGKVTY